MKLIRKTKALTKTPLVVYFSFFILLIVLFLTFSSSLKKEPIAIDNNIEEVVKIDTTESNAPEIYITDAEVSPIIVDEKNTPDSLNLISKKQEEKPAEKLVDNKQVLQEKKKSEEKKLEEKASITSIGKDRMLTAFIPGTMGKPGKLPSHNCKVKGELTMVFTVDKSGNVISAGRSSGIKDACATTAAVIWLKQYVKAKKSASLSKGSYTIKF